MGFNKISNIKVYTVNTEYLTGEHRLKVLPGFSIFDKDILKNISNSGVGGKTYTLEEYQLLHNSGSLELKDFLLLIE